MKAFPKEFIALLQSSLPREEYQCVLEAFEHTSSTSVRFNSQKTTFDLLQLPKDASPIPWEPHAVQLPYRPSFVSDPLFHAGAYYVQESSSMIIGYLIKELLKSLKDSALILDLCSAPGGKSTHILQNKRPQDLLIANEVIKSRAHILIENIKKWGHTDQCVISIDALAIGNCETAFNIIVADMPCSGEGLFRKDLQAIDEWGLKNVELCKQRQRRIAADIWPALSTDGYFIYATCTFNKLENEENIRWICKELGAETVPFSFSKEWNIYEQEKGCYRMLPGRVLGEGFFFSVLKKTAETEKIKKKKRTKITINSSKPNHEIARYLLKPMSLLTLNGHSSLVQEDIIEGFLTFFQSFPFPLYFGVAPGIFQKNKFKPSAEFILSNIYNKTLAHIEASDEEALAFLCREPMNLNLEEGLYGWNYHLVPIGYFMMLHNRVQHGWPMDWRIRNKPNIKTVYNHQQKLSLFLSPK